MNDRTKPMMFKMPPDIETTLCIFRDDLFSAKQYWHQRNSGPYPQLTPVRHPEIVLAGFKPEEVNEELIEKYLSLVYDYSVTGNRTDEACSRTAFDIYVQLRVWCALKRYFRRAQKTGNGETRTEKLWPETFTGTVEKPQAAPVPYKITTKPCKKK